VLKTIYCFFFSYVTFKFKFFSSYPTLPSKDKIKNSKTYIGGHFHPTQGPPVVAEIILDGRIRHLNTNPQRNVRLQLCPISERSHRTAPEVLSQDSTP